MARRPMPTLDLGASVSVRRAPKATTPVTRALLAELAKLEPGASIEVPSRARAGQ